MWEDYESENPTSQYQQGTLVIYSSPKKPKITKPKYGYKFVQTQSTRKTRRKK